MEVVFRTAAQALEDERSRLKLTTGNGDLDTLIGGVELGRSYLFYGDSSIYSGLIAQVVSQTPSAGISTGQPITISDLGPSGISKEYSLPIMTYNTPPGKYKLSIVVTVDGETEAQYTVELTVEAG